MSTQYIKLAINNVQVNERANLSYVMQYGDMNIVQDTLDTYMGANTINTTTATDSKSPRFNTTYKPLTSDEAKLLYLKHQVILIFIYILFKNTIYISYSIRVCL
jgi:hypothetical protein